MEKGTITKITWHDIRNKILLINPELAKIIDEIDPNVKYPLYKASYPYGSYIVREGIFYLPSTSGNIVPIEDERIDLTVRDDLTYSGTGIPAGIVLEHTIHESVITSHQTLPLGVVAPGSIFALWKKLDNDLAFHPIHMFSITAGARFIFMIPNISNLLQHRNLKRDFNLSLAPPRNLLDQFKVFKAIASHPENKCNWFSKLLFFSKPWFDKIKNDHAWKALKLFMLETAWKKSSYERNNIFYCLAFSRAQANRNLRPNPFLADTAKHHFMIAAGITPGFAPAVDDRCAPNKLIREAYLKSYGLIYNPTIFLPKHFCFDKPNNQVYYSMSLPTTLEFSPKSRQISSTINDLIELKHIINIFLDECRKKHLKIENTIIGRIANEVSFEYFHNKPDKNGEIQPSYKMIDKDLDLLYCSSQKTSKMKFADSGTFVRGCIRVSKN